MADISNRSEADRVLNCLTLGFATDPLARWIYPDPADFLAHFPRLVNYVAGRAFERGSAYRNEGFTAAALWLPPEAHQDEEGLLAHLEQTVAPEKLGALIATFEQMDKFHPAEPCWHLAFLATDPAFQRMGLGTALLTATLKRCDDEGMLAYLETPNVVNQSLYRRFGFEQIGMIDVAHAPPVFTMLRRPVQGALSSRA
jgi:ribosomal protein S18 acetylase RimI-like enzyme